MHLDDGAHRHALRKLVAISRQRGSVVQAARQRGRDGNDGVPRLDRKGVAYYAHTRSILRYGMHGRIKYDALAKLFGDSTGDRLRAAMKAFFLRSPRYANQLIEGATRMQVE